MPCAGRYLNCFADALCLLARCCLVMSVPLNYFCNLKTNIYFSVSLRKTNYNWFLLGKNMSDWAKYMFMKLRYHHYLIFYLIIIWLKVSWSLCYSKQRLSRYYNLVQEICSPVIRLRWDDWLVIFEELQLWEMKLWERFDIWIYEWSTPLYIS